MTLKKMCLLLILASGTASCSHRPADPAIPGKSAYVAPAYEARATPWGTVAIRSVKDGRPSSEISKTNFLRESFVSDELYDRPVPVMLKRLLTTEISRSRVFEVVDTANDAEFLIDIDVRHFYGRWDASVLSIVPILPAIDVDCQIDLEITLVDQDGRPFLASTLRRRDSTTTTSASDPKSAAEALLGRLLGECMQELLAKLDSAVPEFWGSLGLPIPRRDGSAHFE